MLRQRGFIEERDGGASLIEPLLIGKNTTAKAFSGYDILDTTPQTGISAAEYDWKQVACQVTVSGREKFQNMGSKTQVLNLVSSKISQAEISLALEIERQLYRDGTGNLGKELTGLEVLVENGVAWSVVGGIDSNANTYWRNQWESGAAYSTTANLLAGMTRIYNSCMRGTIRPGLIVTSQPVYQEYEQKLRAGSHLYPQENSLGELGFQHLVFKSTPIVFDDQVGGSGTTDNVMYFLTPEFLKFVIGRGFNFVSTDFQKPDNQDAWVGSILLYGNMVTNNRARQGRIDGIPGTLGD